MKIAFLIWDYSPSRGGQERYLSRLIGVLRRRGHEIHVLAAHTEPDAAADIRFHKVPVPDITASMRTILYLKKGRAVLSEEKFDIVSGLTRFYPLDVYRMGSGLHRVWMRKKADSLPGRLSSYARPFNWLAMIIEARIFTPSNCRHIIANSRLCRGQLLDFYRYPPERVSVVYNGIDHEQFHPRLRAEYRSSALERLRIPEGKTVALFAANNLRRKGLDAVIKALARPVAENAYLLVAGKGNAGTFLALAAKLGVAGRMRFLGHVDDVRPYYGAADVLVLPTRYDPFANVCLEAMACGLPVITTRDNGASEIITEQINGWLLSSPADSAGIAARLAEMGSNAAREQMSKAARNGSLPYTIERNAAETLDIYTRVLEEKHGRSR